MAESRSLYPLLAETFGYFGKPRYLLAMRALDVPSVSIGTASLINGSSHIGLRSPTLFTGKNVEPVKSTIAHEMTHNWVRGSGSAVTAFSQHQQMH